MTRLEAVPGARGGLTRAVLDQSVLFTHALGAVQRLGARGAASRRYIPRCAILVGFLRV